MKKKGLIILATIVLLTTACTKENNEVNEPEKTPNTETAYYEFGMPTTASSTNYQDVIKESGSNVIVKSENGQLSVCIYINDTLECFENNNYQTELNHLRNVFGDDGCGTEYSFLSCYHHSYDSISYECTAFSEGSVKCRNLGGIYEECIIYPDGTVKCELPCGEDGSTGCL